MAQQPFATRKSPARLSVRLTKAALISTLASKQDQTVTVVTVSSILQSNIPVNAIQDVLAMRPNNAGVCLTVCRFGKILTGPRYVFLLT
jgi:hypothetical protein